MPMFITPMISAPITTPTIVPEPPAIEEGWLVLPDRPGLGVELAEGLEERYPYIEGAYGIQVQR